MTTAARVATLLTDVEGSTRRWEADAEAMLDLLIQVSGRPHTGPTTSAASAATLRLSQRRAIPTNRR